MNVIGFSLIVFAAVLAYGSALPPSGRIVGGYPADIKKFPYQLALLLKGRLFCGASVLSKRWVLTASHCLENKDAVDVSFRGGSSYHFTGGEVIQAKAIFMHPLYDPVSTQYDAALVYTDSDIVGENIKPITVVDEDLVSVPGEYVTISGWGYISDFSHVIPHHLQYTEVATVLQSECDRKLHYFGGVSETMFCAAAYKTDGCQGDSGGPAVLNGVQVGVVSWGIGCADIRFPGVYTNLANPAIRSWIKEMTNL